MRKKDKLFVIADRQQGYFTARQAEKSGISRSNFHLRIRSGEWIKQFRGIYRLSNYPIGNRSELVLWTLWSQDKKGKPQGIWSHETALDIYELSDIMPPKMHMSVPMCFRRRSAIPKHLHIHFVDIPKSDVKEREGYKVTTPIRTLVDIIREGRLAHEHIVFSAIEMVRRGLTTIQEIRKISEWSISIEKVEIANLILKAIEKLINGHNF